MPGSPGGVGSPSASELVSQRVASGGPIRFDEYLELALYADGAGFYTAAGGRAGRRRGDFITSPEVGPLFGAVVGRYLDQVWDELGCPDPFVVVDAGAGPGTLAVAVRSAAPRCAEALTYVLVERSATQRALHAERLGHSLCAGEGDGPRFVSSATLPDGPFRGVVLANELLDNLAFRVLERTDDGWCEVYVGEGPVEVLGPVVAADEGLADQLAPNAAVGARLALQQEAAGWVAGVVGRLTGGRLLVIDYVTTSAAMAARPWSEWLRTYSSHRGGGHPLEDPGTRDITCEVAVDQLERIRPATRKCTQAEWLVAVGIDELVDAGRRIWTERAHVGDLAALAARSRVREAEALCDPTGLGAFGVLEWVVAADV